MPVSEQLFSFALLLIFGAVLGLAIDFYRAGYRKARPGKILGGTADLLLWLLLAAGTFLGLLHSNSGEVRVYVFIALALGFVIYSALMGRFFRRLFSRLFAVLGWFITVIVTVVSSPFRVLRRLAALVFRGIGGRFTRRHPPPPV